MVGRATATQAWTATEEVHMMTRRFARTRELLLAAALGLAVFGPSLALAQGRSAPTAQSHEHGQTSDGAGQPNALGW
jgi:hypothetical protein